MFPRCCSWCNLTGKHLQLYSTENSAPRIIARIGKSYNIVSLEMTSAALDQGLLEVCAVTTVLLQCGRNID